MRVFTPSFAVFPTGCDQMNSTLVNLEATVKVFLKKFWSFYLQQLSSSTCAKSILKSSTR